MLGSSTPIRHSVRARSRWLSSWARTSAISSCGTVATHEDPERVEQGVPEVVVAEQLAVVVEADPAVVAEQAPVVQRDPEGEQQREQAEDREDEEERRDEGVAGDLLAARAAAGSGAGLEPGRCRPAFRSVCSRGSCLGVESGRPAGPALKRRDGPAGRVTRTRSRSRGQPAAASASETAVAQPSSARLLAVLDAAHRILDRIAHRLVLRAEEDRLEAAGAGHEELSDRGVAEVLVGEALERRRRRRASGWTAGCRPPRRPPSGRRRWSGSRPARSRGPGACSTVGTARNEPPQLPPPPGTVAMSHLPAFSSPACSLM